MTTWGDFAAADPELADFIHQRLNGKVSFLATVRKDGAPRVHPVTPIIGEGRLFLFMEPTSLKGHDLRRDSLHGSVTDNSGASGEALVRGDAAFTGDSNDRDTAVEAAGYSVADRYILFELSVEQVASTEHIDGKPVHRSWSSS